MISGCYLFSLSTPGFGPNYYIHKLTMGALPLAVCPSFNVQEHFPSFEMKRRGKLNPPAAPPALNTGNKGKIAGLSGARIRENVVKFSREDLLAIL